MIQSHPSKRDNEVVIPGHVYSVKTGAIGGLLGGIVMGVVALGYGALWRGSPWLPVNVVAATFMPGLQTVVPEQLAQFSLQAFFVASLIHFALAILIGVLFALILPVLPGSPIVWAVVVGPILWVIATVITLPLVNPLGARVIDWPSFVLAHLAYGLVMGLYVARSREVPAQ